MSQKSGSAELKCGTKPFVSIIIPAYNAAEYIGDALHSIFAQTYRHFEVIIINDGSSDTVELERVLSPFSERLIYIKQNNEGPSAARNSGIARARGDYLAFLDSDDMWLPHCLAFQVSLALSKQRPYDFVYGDMLLTRESPTAQSSGARGLRYSDMCPSDGEVTFASLLTEKCQAPTSCVLLRRERAIEVGLFDPRFRRAEDYDLWLRVAHRGAEMIFQNEILGVRRMHAASLTSNNIDMLEGLVAVLQKVARELPLSDAQQLLVRSKLLDTSALVALERGKAELLNRSYRKALALFSSANCHRRSWRLASVIRSLQIAPCLAGPLLQVWARMSQSRSRA